MASHKVLVVDDDKDIVNIVRMTLAAEGREFIVASNGVEAVEKALSEMPDLIVLDVMMPKMNGYQVCRLLKNEKTTWEIPVLMLTGKARERDRYYGLSVGADDYIVKPFRPDDLRQKADQLLDIVPSRKICPIKTNIKGLETDILSKVNSLLDRKLQQMTFLQYMTKSIVATFDEEKIMETVLGGIGSDIGYEKAAIFMFEEGAMVRKKATEIFGPDRETLDLSRKDVFSPILNDRRPSFLFGKDVIAAEAESGRAQVQQQCLVPIIYRDEVKGVILIERREFEPPFSDERVGLLTTLSGQLGLALENASLYRTVLHLSITDGLTGLYNARYFYDKLELEMSRARRYGHPLSLLMLDIDYFKVFNDTYGHLSGDEALRHFARLMKEKSRETDTVARYGGEEFCMILPETDSQNAEVLAERIRSVVETTPLCTRTCPQPAGMTVSIGIITMPESLVTAEELVRMADKALYGAKEEGRNRVKVY